MSQSPSDWLRSTGIHRGALPVLVAVAGLVGCRGERTLSVTSTPVGAEVRLDEELVGVTPITIPIDHYGQRRLTLYRAGSRLHSEAIDLDAPWWAYFPVDIVTELLNPVRLHDRQAHHVDLLPATGVEAEPLTTSFIEEAIRIRSEAKAQANARMLQDPSRPPQAAVESEAGPR